MSHINKIKYYRRKEEEEDRQLAEDRRDHQNKLSQKSRRGKGTVGGTHAPDGIYPISRQDEAEMSKLKLLNRTAKSFYKRQLLIRHGLSPWVLLVKERRYVCEID